MRSVAGVRVWPAVLLIGLTWALAVVVPFAVVVLLGRLVVAHPAYVPFTLAAAVAAGTGWLAVYLVPNAAYHGELAQRFVLIRRPVDWHAHARVAEHVARRSPKRAEDMLRRGLAEGSSAAYRPLAALLRQQDREDELVQVRTHLVEHGTPDQLRRIVDWVDWGKDKDLAAAAQLQAAVVARDPATPREHEHLAALLAETGAFDEAMAAQREAVRLRKEAHREAVRRWEEASRKVLFPGKRPAAPPLDGVYYLKRTARALARAGRLANAETVLRAGLAHPDVLLPLALVMRARGRTDRAEELLRKRPEAQRRHAEYALYVLQHGEPAQGRDRRTDGPEREPVEAGQSRTDPFESLWYTLSEADHGRHDGGSHHGGSHHDSHHGGGHHDSHYGGHDSGSHHSHDSGGHHGYDGGGHHGG